MATSYPHNMQPSTEYKIYVKIPRKRMYLYNFLAYQYKIYVGAHYIFNDQKNMCVNERLENKIFGEKRV